MESTDETPSRPLWPSERDLATIEFHKRLKFEEDMRERNWRESADCDRPLELDYFDGQRIDSLAFALCRPHANGKLTVEQANEVQTKVKEALLGFLREISPSDRHSFFAVTEQIRCRRIIVPEGRRKVKELMENEYEDPYEAEKRYKALLISINPAHTADRSLRNDRLALEREGRSGLRPDGMNEIRLGEKKEEEWERSCRVIKAQEQRNIRRMRAANEYFELWERIEEEGLLPEASDHVTELMHPMGALADEQNMRIQTTNDLSDVRKEWEERARKGLSDPFSDYLNKIRAGPSNPNYSKLVAGFRQRTPLTENRGIQSICSPSNQLKIIPSDSPEVIPKSKIPYGEEIDFSRDSSVSIDVLLQEEVEDGEMEYEEGTGVEDAFEELDVADTLHPSLPLPPHSTTVVPPCEPSSYSDQSEQTTSVFEEPLPIVVDDEDEEVNVVDDDEDVNVVDEEVNVVDEDVNVVDEDVNVVDEDEEVNVVDDDDEIAPTVTGIGLEMGEKEKYEEKNETVLSHHSGMDAPSTSAQSAPIEAQKIEPKRKNRRKKKVKPDLAASHANDEETKMLLASFLVDFSQGSSRDSSVTRSQSSTSSSSPPHTSAPSLPSPLIGVSIPSTSRTTVSPTHPIVLRLPSLPAIVEESSLTDHDYSKRTEGSDSLSPSSLPITTSTSKKKGTTKTPKVRTARSPSPVPSSSSSSPSFIPSAADYSNLEFMCYEAPRNSEAARNLQRLTKNATRSDASDEDWERAMHERKRHDQLFYALSLWPREKFPIEGLRPYENLTREQAIKFLGLKKMAEPTGETDSHGDFSVMRLDQLHALKNSVKETTKIETEKTKATEDTSEMGPPPVPFRPVTVSIPETKPLSMSPLESSSSSSVSTFPSSPIAEEEVDESIATNEDTISDAALLSPIPSGSISSPIQKKSLPSTIPTESPFTSPIPTEPTEIQLSRGSSEESERKRKISDEENSEGEPETKRREKNEKIVDQGEASVEETIESANDDMVDMGSGDIPIDDLIDETEEEDVDVAELEELFEGDDDCRIVAIRTSVLTLPGQSGGEKAVVKEEEPAYESTGHVISIQMAPVNENDEQQFNHIMENEYEAPDPREAAYHLPYRDVTLPVEEEDKKEDEQLIAARAAIERGEGLTGEEGEIVGGKSGIKKKAPHIPESQYKLILYLLKNRYDDDFLPSQRHLRYFADIIQNKLVSTMREQNPSEWSHQFYKVVRSELITSTLYQSVPRTFESDLLQLQTTSQFKEWREGRECNFFLLEEAVKAEDTKFKSLVEEAMNHKDTFTLVRARAVLRKMTMDVPAIFDELAVGDEDENEEYKSLSEEVSEKVKSVFIFSIYTITHSIDINNRSRNALKPYELLRVMAYTLEGWTGWLERGGIYRLFVTVCERREKEGGYVPLGKENAQKMRDRIETRVSAICEPLRVIETEGEERASVYMITQLKEREEKDTLMTSLRSFKDNDKTGRKVRCGFDLGTTRTKCTLRFKSEEEVHAHKSVCHLWRGGENPMATKCPKCVRYFLMDSSLLFHQLVAHHDYEEEEEEEGDEPGEGELRRIQKIAADLLSDFKRSALEWNPEEREVKVEEETMEE